MIYLLHEDAGENAKMLDDASLNRQIKAIAQTLCNTYWLAGWNFLRNELYTEPSLLACSKNAASCKFTTWASECRANYLRFAEMGFACIQECLYRWNEPIPEGVKYKYAEIIKWLRDNVPDLPVIPGATPFPVCMPKELIIYFLPSAIDFSKTEQYTKINTIESYRKYCRVKLSEDAKWTRRERPDWL